MGWNDRLPEDPFIPAESYYEEHDRYAAWLEYQNICAAETERQLTSQNIDPAMLAGKPSQETPQRRHTLSRLWEKFFGQEIASKASHENDKPDFPF
jgi:hypothetical protein